MDRPVLLVFPAPTEARVRRPVASPLGVSSRASHVAAEGRTSPPEHGCTAHSYRWRNPRGSCLGGRAPGKLGRAHSTGEPPASTRRACATTGSRIQSTSALPAPAGISNSDSEFSSCGPYSGVDSAFPVGGWQRLAADQSVTPGSKRPEFRCFSVAEQDS